MGGGWSSPIFHKKELIYIYILIIILAIILLVFFSKLFMIPMFGNLVLVSGAVKSGKTTFSVHIAKRKYKKVLFAWYVHYFFVKWFFPIVTVGLWRPKLREKPLFYSNIPIVIKNYVPITDDLLLRRARFAYKSVIFIDEASLVADSMLYKDKDASEAIMLFNKLIAHQTKGGNLVYNTQSCDDLHHGIRRCIGTYFYVHHKVVLPFFVMLYVREMFYAPEGTTVNVSEGTVTETFKRVLVPKSVWKDFDCYAFSSLTDDLPVVTDTIRYTRKDSLKVKKLFSFRYFKSIREELQSKDEKED